MDETFFERASRHIVEAHGQEIGENWNRFVRQVYATPAEVYLERLRAVDMAGQEAILDAGCGFGQWSVCMSDGNNTVHAVDHDEKKVRAVSGVFAMLGNPNARAWRADITALDTPDERYTAAFCYGALFTTAWKQALAEFRRVLRPGGLLYFTANDIGFVLNLWLNQPHKTADYDPREVAALSLLNTVRYGRSGRRGPKGQIVISREEALSELDRLGFDVLDANGEGMINRHPGELRPQPFFKSEYHGLPGCYEVLARRR